MREEVKKQVSSSLRRTFLKDKNEGSTAPLFIEKFIFFIRVNDGGFLVVVQALKGSGIVIGVDMTVDEVARLIFLHNVQEGFESAVRKVGTISNTGGGGVG